MSKMTPTFSSVFGKDVIFKVVKPHSSKS